MSFINWGSETPEQKAIRRRFEEDQAIFEQRAAAMSAAAAAAGVGSGSKPIGPFKFVVDTQEWSQIRLEFVSTNEPIQYIIDWGDGNIHEDSGYGGYYEEFHEYSNAGQYTVKVTFDDPGKILQLDFEGPDEGYATLVSITGLQNLRNLEYFRADYNSLESVDLSGMTDLTYVDISDCDQVGSNDPSLKTVKLNGCTNLEELRLDDSDFSDGLPDLIGLTNLRYIDFDQCGITGSVNLSNFPQLVGFDFSGNPGLTEIIISNNQSIGDGRDINAYGCDLTQSSIDSILVALSTNGVTNGYVDLGGSGVPSPVGLAALTVLEQNGWTVYVDIPV